MPVLLFGAGVLGAGSSTSGPWWRRASSRPADIEIFQYVETAEEAWEILKPVMEAVAASAG